MNTMIQTLRSQVTHFSEELKHKCDIKQEVTVGGKILEVVALGPVYEEENGYAITLDDFVGETRVIISQDMHDHFRPILLPGSFVLIDGFVNKLSRKLAGDEETQYSVVGFDMRLMTL